MNTMKKAISLVLCNSSLVFGLTAGVTPVYASSYDDAINAYADYLYSRAGSGSQYRFDLVYLNGNDIPELYVSTIAHAVSEVEFFEYDGSSVYSLGSCQANCGICYVAEGECFIEGYYAATGRESYAFYGSDDEEVFLATNLLIINTTNPTTYQIDGDAVGEDEFYDTLDGYEDGYDFTEIGGSYAYDLTSEGIEAFLQDYAGQ